ncbi:phage tail tape measure C-terminal domain-containing protein [Novosphingobium sp. ST904]|uniref:phage tail tape measure C-terminal domain-containing protein n=1 Tax=Novosphingobium sp. ST904 TaxID=1684385 RepID=UPI0006C89D8C|nr:phage tail tape measure C-terminal domain-containing protein [Novosphingobium sp. ST904]KPH66903.1 hypothetical protein ADT71_03895 [Novosphingobium sp. ST904]TCM39151.1 tail tape-measure protein [Novosphingobium sp. ST904]
MALGDVIARLAVNLTMDTAAFEQGADVAEKRLAQSAKNIDKLGQKMKGIGEKLSLSFTAPFAALVALADDAKGLKAAAQVAGETFEAFQRGAASAKSIGVDYEKFGDILKDTREKLGDFAANGGGELADFFQNVAPKVGVTIDMFRDLSGSQALQLYYDSLVKAGVPQQQMVFYMESIADEGSALIPILRDNGKAMKEIGANAAVISEDDAASLEKYTEAQTALANAFTKLKVAIANTGIVDVVTAMVDAFAGLVDWFSELPPGLQQIGVAIGAVVLAAGPLLVVFGTIISSGSTLFAALGSIGASMASVGTVSGALTVGLAALRAAIATLVTFIGPWGIALAAIGVALGVVIAAVVSASKADKAYSAALAAATEASKKAEKAATDLASAHGKAREEALKLAKAEAENIKKKLESARASVKLAQAELIRAQSYQAAQASAAASAGGTAPGLTSGIMRMRGDATANKANENLKAAQDTVASLTASLEKVQKAIDAPEAPIFTSAVKPDKSKGAKASKPTMATAEEQQRELDSLAMEELRARQEIATSAEERADLSQQLLDMEKAQRIEEIKSDKTLTDAQKKARLDAIARLYGPDSSEGEIVVSPGLYDKKLQQEIADEQAQLANDMLARQAGTLDAMADIEPNTRERARLEAESLALQQKIQRNLLEQDIANGRIADADTARAQLATQQAAERQRQSVQNMSPVERYRYDLQSSVSNINDAMENVQVDAMDGLVDGISKAISGTQKLGDVFKNVAQQIIADLVRIQLQKAIVGSLSNALGGLGSLFGGGTSINGVSGSSFLGGLAMETNDWVAAGAPLSLNAYATGTSNAARGLALVGERGPELVNFSGGERVYKNADTKTMMGGRAASQTIIHMSGVMTNDEFWSTVNDVSTSNANSAVTAGRQRDARRTTRKLGR